MEGEEEGPSDSTVRLELEELVSGGSLTVGAHVPGGRGSAEHGDGACERRRRRRLDL